ncbi:MAG: hypothetical protein ACK557_00610, partial [Planctomycetota bacterium]
MILATLALFAAACGWSPTTISAQGKPLKVFILAGQSNMEGQGVVARRDDEGEEVPGTLAWIANDPRTASL